MLANPEVFAHFSASCVVELHPSCNLWPSSTSTSASRLVPSIPQFAAYYYYRARAHLRSEFTMETYLSLAARMYGHQREGALDLRNAGVIEKTLQVF